MSPEKAIKNYYLTGQMPVESHLISTSIYDDVLRAGWESFKPALKYLRGDKDISKFFPEENWGDRNAVYSAQPMPQWLEEWADARKYTKTYLVTELRFESYEVGEQLEPYGKPFRLAPEEHAKYSTKPERRGERVGRLYVLLVQSGELIVWKNIPESSFKVFDDVEKVLSEFKTYPKTWKFLLYRNYHLRDAMPLSLSLSILRGLSKILSESNKARKWSLEQDECIAEGIDKILERT